MSTAGWIFSGVVVVLLVWAVVVYNRLVQLRNRIANAFGQIDVCEIATQIHCPTLVMHAKDDARVPFEEGRHMASLIPGARFVSLDSQNHVLLQGEPAFDQCLAEIRGFLQAQQPLRGPQQVFPSLTTGERALLELLAHGLDNLQISAHLGLSEKTVRNKVSSVFSKLEAPTRAQAIVRARDAGFGRSDLPR